MRRTCQPCKLCGQAKLLCQSHIVPELAYKPIKDGKGQVYEVGRRTRKVQVGYRERLLCQECERLLSRHEAAFARVWMATIPPNFRHLRTERLTDVISVDIPDYTSFKLFHLSVLWRAGVSSGFKVDPTVSLGPHADEIAGLIRQGDPGLPGDFAFFASLNLDRQGRPVPTVHQLARGVGEFKAHPYYMMSYAYCDWFFFMGRPGPQFLKDLEVVCRKENVFLLLPVLHTRSKSFRLGVEMLRRLRR